MKFKEKLLIEKVLQGNNAAILEFWNIWSPKIMTFIVTNGKLKQEDREDLLQEIMIKVFMSLDQYNPFYSFSTWIYTISKRQIIDFFKRRCFTQVENIEMITNDDFAPDTVYEKNEETDLLINFINNLSHTDKQIVHLCFYESLSIRAASRIMKLPYETVRYRYKRIQSQLREVINAEQW